MFLDRFRKKKKEEPLPVLPAPPPTLPEDLERFRVTPESSFGRPSELAETKETGDKTELILQKLETIDARLRFIEEKLRRY